MTKPEPSELTLRDWPSLSCSSKKSLKNSSKGEPLGPGPGPERAVFSAEPFSVWVVEMLTTVFCSSSAMSATDSGPRAKLAVLSSGAMASSRASAADLKPKGIGVLYVRPHILSVMSPAPAARRISHHVSANRDAWQT